MKDRIFSLMKEKGMSQKTFAAEICIAEGSLSSIFSGRTRPTLNVVANIHERFPEVSMSWLMDGKGEMYVTGEATGSVSAPELPFPDANPAPTNAPVSSGIPLQASFAEQLMGTVATPSPQAMPHQQRTIPDKPQRRIMEIRVFYDDGTFETFPARN